MTIASLWEGVVEVTEEVSEREAPMEGLYTRKMLSLMRRYQILAEMW